MAVAGGAVALLGGAVVGRISGRARGRSTGEVVLFLTVFPLSGAKQQRGTVIMGVVGGLVIH